MDGITVFALTTIGIALFIGAFYLFLDFVDMKAEQSRKERELREAQSQHPERHLPDGTS
ncbi:MAG: hypothetical protein ACYCY2_07195 [Acidithiobacillus ferriphilus]|nr:hypothetical protein [Acidithiobacillus ferrivorans]